MARAIPQRWARPLAADRALVYRVLQGVPAIQSLIPRAKAYRAARRRHSRQGCTCIAVRRRYPSRRGCLFDRSHGCTRSRVPLWRRYADAPAGAIFALHPLRSGRFHYSPVREGNWRPHPTWGYRHKLRRFRFGLYPAFGRIHRRSINSPFRLKRTIYNQQPLAAWNFAIKEP